jgi:FlaA1/EpsC-like NDP-sugar epimerase
VTKDNLNDEDVNGFIENCICSGIKTIWCFPELHSYTDMRKNPTRQIERHSYVNVAKKLNVKAFLNNISIKYNFWTNDDLREVSVYFYQNLRDLLGKRSLFVWGAGQNGKKLLKIFKENKFDYKITGFVDANPDKYGQVINDIQIYSPTTILNNFSSEKPYVIISSTVYAQEIHKQLEMNDFIFQKDFLFFDFSIFAS